MDYTYRYRFRNHSIRGLCPGSLPRRKGQTFSSFHVLLQRDDQDTARPVQGLQADFTLVRPKDAGSFMENVERQIQPYKVETI